MTNITIDDVIDYIIIMLSEDDKEIELTDTEMSILIDTVRDHQSLSYNLNCKIITKLENFENFYTYPKWVLLQDRKNLSRSKEEEMSDICKIFNCKVKYQPERIPKLLKLRKATVYKIK